LLWTRVVCLKNLRANQRATIKGRSIQKYQRSGGNVLGSMSLTREAFEFTIPRTSGTERRQIRQHKKGSERRLDSPAIRRTRMLFQQPTRSRSENN
jgi:hypothetical protein